jgi:hypothetical protein
MSNFNYCYDECPYNRCPRNYWTEVINAKPKTFSSAVKGSLVGPKFKLYCELGYSQTVNSHKALVNSKKQGSRICPRLTKLFARG